MTARRRKICLFTLILFFYASLFFGPYLWQNLYCVFFSRQEIVSTSATLSLDETDALTILNRIADWLQNNVKWDTTQWRFLPFYWRKMHPSPNWVMSVRRGACEENAVLFAALANSSGIRTRIIFNSGEDHVWNEAWINGTWMHFDATLPEEVRFNHPGFYETPKEGGGWGKQLSYVWSLDLNGTISNVTRAYSNTGNLVVKVEREGKPAENVQVIVESRFLMETRPEKYKNPVFALSTQTDPNGCCHLNLGKNNYTVIARTADERIEGYVSLLEGNSTTVTLHLAKSGHQFTLSPVMFSIALVCTYSVFVILLSLITYYIGRILKRRFIHAHVYTGG